MTVRLLTPAYGKQTNALYTGTQVAERALIDAGQADNNLSSSFEYPDYLAGKSMAPPASTATATATRSLTLIAFGNSHLNDNAQRLIHSDPSQIFGIEPVMSPLDKLWCGGKIVKLAALATSGQSNNAQLAAPWPYASGTYTACFDRNLWKQVTFTQGAASIAWTGNINWSAFDLAVYSVPGVSGEDYPIFFGDSGIMSTTLPFASTDPGAAVAVRTHSVTVMNTVRSLRDAYSSKLGRIRIANCGVGGSALSGWVGDRSATFIANTANAIEGDTLVVGGVTYRFTATPSQIYDVLIGGTSIATLQNLFYAINIDPANTSGYFPGTPQNPNIVALSIPSSGVYARVHSRAVGAATNNLVVSGGNLARISGADSASAVPVASVNLTGGGDESGLWRNLLFRTKQAGIGQVDAGFCTLPTNDALRVGLRGADMPAYLNKLLAQWKAEFPGVPLIFDRPFQTRSGFGNLALVNTILPAIDAWAAANADVVSLIDLYGLGLGVGLTAGTGIGSSGATRGETSIIEETGPHGTQLGQAYLVQLTVNQIARVCGLV